jgi:hypothetical protein
VTTADATLTPIDYGDGREPPSAVPSDDLQQAMEELEKAQPGYITAEQYYKGTRPEVVASRRMRRAMARTRTAYRFNFARKAVQAVAEALEIASVDSTTPGAKAPHRPGVEGQQARPRIQANYEAGQRVRRRLRDRVAVGRHRLGRRRRERSTCSTTPRGRSRVLRPREPHEEGLRGQAVGARREENGPRRPVLPRPDREVDLQAGGVAPQGRGHGPVLRRRRRRPGRPGRRRRARLAQPEPVRPDPRLPLP